MPKTEQIFCSDIARHHNLPLTASATRGDLWFLLEYAGRFESKAFEQSTIPDEVKQYLKNVQIPGLKTRILLIRQTDSRHRPGLNFFIGHTDPQKPTLYQYRLETYHDLLELDLARIIKDGSRDSTALRSEPLYLVCTNGRRDLCCARYGPAIYKAMQAMVGDAVWQSSHIGGHNKAPNTLFFPYGVESGYTNPALVSSLLRDFQQKRLNLEYYRGRVCFDPPVQAAEHFWRQETGILDLPGMQLVSVESLAENEWRVVVQGTDGSHRRQLHIQRRDSEPQLPTTCALDKLSPITSYHRVG